MFALAVSNKAYPLVPPEVIGSTPDGEPLTLDLARMLAASFLDTYVSNYNLKGRAVARARFACGSLEPGHYVELDTLRIELRNTSLILQ